MPLAPILHIVGSVSSNLLSSYFRSWKTDGYERFGAQSWNSLQYVQWPHLRLAYPVRLDYSQY